MSRTLPRSAMRDQDVGARLTHEWDVRGIDISSLQLDHRGTIVPRGDWGATTTAPARRTPPPTAGLTDLPELDPAAIGGASELELGHTLGEGGMGIVWSAVQRPLRREVAVKSLHPRANPPEAIPALLREARVTGALEHPNVVPIHALARDPAGRPLIVMKRIEGVSWSELLEDQTSQGPGVVMSQLEHHVRVLIDVAKATHFAHSRGIVHRDLKPDNVMIGSFGEVYLVDWGIAVSLREDNALELPFAKSIREVTGSPGYMAPEMAVGDGNHIDARTDVYLLGATLHEIITGLPPHDGPNAEAMLTSAYASPPYPYDPSVPAELAAICHTAMNRDPEARYHSASSFAAALNRFLEHRDSTVLTDEASAKLEALRDAVAVAGAEPDKHALYHLFNECRFGFQNALRIWESNTRARELLQEAIELMIGYELDRGSAGAAAALIGELPIKRGKLMRRVDEKRDREHQDEAELERLKRAADLTGADRPRAYLAFGVALSWPAVHAALYWAEGATRYAIAHVELAAAYGLYAAGSLIVGIAARETFMSRSRFGLPTQLTLTLIYLASTLLWPLCRALGLDVPDSYTLLFFLNAAMWSAGAIAVDQRMLAWAASTLVGLVLTLGWPDQAILWMGGAGTVGSSVMAWLRFRTPTAESALPLSQRWSRRQAERVASTRRS